MKNKIEKRLSYLYTGETVAIIGFIIVSYLLNRANPSLHLYGLTSFWAAFILLNFLLVQGAMYWYAKYKRFKKENTTVTPTRVVQRLKACIKWNIGFIIVIPIFFLIDYLNFNQELPVAGLSIALFIYLFAILEFINYFYIQLSHDSRSDIMNLIRTKTLKRSSLRKDFERLQKGDTK